MSDEPSKPIDPEELKQDLGQIVLIIADNLCQPTSDVFKVKAVKTLLAELDLSDFETHVPDAMSPLDYCHTLYDQEVSNCHKDYGTKPSLQLTACLTKASQDLTNCEKTHGVDSQAESEPPKEQIAPEELEEGLSRIVLIIADILCQPTSDTFKVKAVKTLLAKIDLSVGESQSSDSLTPMLDYCHTLYDKEICNCYNNWGKKPSVGLTTCLINASNDLKQCQKTHG